MRTKNYFTFLALCITTLTFAQNVTIPDAAFKAELVADTNINTNSDSEIQVTEANTFIGTITVQFDGIADLTGIEEFTAATGLNCKNNNLIALDLSANVALVTLNCSNNDLASLIAPSSNSLETLDCSSNSLSTLNISANTALISLSIDNNSFSTIDISSNINLEYFYASSTGLNTIDFSANTALININMPYNNLSNLDVSTNINLETLRCLSNNINSINLSNISGITSLNCAWNNLTALNVSNLTGLTRLECNSNNINGLDLSNNSLLENLHCENNQIPTLNLLNKPALNYLACNSNDLTALNTTDNPLLTYIGCYSNSIGSLNLSTNTILSNINCYSNSLTALDVSNNPQLYNLRCQNNAITDLDVTTNPLLTSLICNANDLSTLNVKNGNNTILSGTGFDATNNPNLICIDVNDVTYSTTNWTNIDAQTSFSTNCTSNIISVSIKAFLQGAYINPISGEETLMRDDLRTASLIPTTTPYTDALTCNASVFTPTGADAIVDWVWVELRDENDNTNILSSQSALLQRDGDIVATDGLSPLSFNLDDGNYYVVVSHRNHLAIISANTVALTGTTTVLDLSTGVSVVTGGENAVEDLGNGIFGIYTGDYNGNGQIQFTDATEAINFVGNSGYSNADMNLNGQIQLTDINNLIYPNAGKGEQF